MKRVRESERLTLRSDASLSRFLIDLVGGGYEVLVTEELVSVREDCIPTGIDHASRPTLHQSACPCSIYTWKEENHPQKYEIPGVRFPRLKYAITWQEEPQSNTNCLPFCGKQTNKPLLQEKLIFICLVNVESSPISLQHNVPSFGAKYLLYRVESSFYDTYLRLGEN